MNTSPLVFLVRTCGDALRVDVRQRLGDFARHLKCPLQRERLPFRGVLTLLYTLGPFPPGAWLHPPGTTFAVDGDKSESILLDREGGSDLPFLAAVERCLLLNTRYRKRAASAPVSRLTPSKVLAIWREVCPRLIRKYPGGVLVVHRRTGEWFAGRDSREALLRALRVHPEGDFEFLSIDERPACRMK